MSTNQPIRGLSLPTVRRLPVYLRLLQDLQQQGHEWVASADIAKHLALEAIQVRKDLAAAGTTGRPRRGYEIQELIRRIESTLGWDNTTDAFLVGAGHLGSALLGYEGFAHHGLNLVAAFDVDDSKVGTTVHGKQVLHLDRLADLSRRLGIQMGVLCVPATRAQAVVDRMIGAGIRAIWNFAPVRLEVPADVVVQDEDLSRGLAELSIRWSKAREKRGAMTAVPPTADTRAT